MRKLLAIILFIPISFNLSAQEVDTIVFKNSIYLNKLKSADVNTYFSLSKIIPMTIPAIDDLESVYINSNLHLSESNLDINSLHISLINTIPSDISNVKINFLDTVSNSFLVSFIGFIAKRSKAEMIDKIPFHFNKNVISYVTFDLNGRQDSTFKADAAWHIDFEAKFYNDFNVSITDESYNIDIYPSFTCDYINILSNPIGLLIDNVQDGNIEIFSQYGVLVYSETIEAVLFSRKIDISFLSSGLYYLRFRNGNFSIIRHFIKF